MIIRRWRLMVLVFIALFGVIACGGEPPDKDDYFPLNKGLSWEYRYQLTTPLKQEEGVYRVSNLGTAEVGGETVTVRRTNEGRDYYLMRKADGVYRYASRTLFQGEPVVDESMRLVLPLPYSDDGERRWSSTTGTYVIHRAGPSTITTDPVPDFLMSYRVVSRDETVVVPAGKFEDCLLVEGVATLKVFADPHVGYMDVPVKTREWYAPGVGLVKLERSEVLDTRIYKGGSYLFELIGVDG